MIGRLIIIKMSILPKLIDKLNSIPIRILIGFYLIPVL